MDFMLLKLLNTSLKSFKTFFIVIFSSPMAFLKKFSKIPIVFRVDKYKAFWV